MRNFIAKLTKVFVILLLILWVITLGLALYRQNHAVSGNIMTILGPWAATVGSWSARILEFFHLSGEYLENYMFRFDPTQSGTGTSIQHVNPKHLEFTDMLAITTAIFLPVILLLVVVHYLFRWLAGVRIFGGGRSTAPAGGGGGGGGGIVIPGTRWIAAAMFAIATVVIFVMILPGVRGYFDMRQTNSVVDGMTEQYNSSFLTYDPSEEYGACRVVSIMDMTLPAAEMPKNAVTPTAEADQNRIRLTCLVNGQANIQEQIRVAQVDSLTVADWVGMVSGSYQMARIGLVPGAEPGTNWFVHYEELNHDAQLLYKQQLEGIRGAVNQFVAIVVVHNGDDRQAVEDYVSKVETRLQGAILLLWSSPNPKDQEAAAQAVLALGGKACLPFALRGVQDPAMLQDQPLADAQEWPQGHLSEEQYQALDCNRQQTANVAVALASPTSDSEEPGGIGINRGEDKSSDDQGRLSRLWNDLTDLPLIGTIVFLAILCLISAISIGKMEGKKQFIIPTICAVIGILVLLN